MCKIFCENCDMIRLPENPRKNIDEDSLCCAPETAEYVETSVRAYWKLGYCKNINVKNDCIYFMEKPS